MLNKCIGFVNVEPGGPVIYVAVTGNEKSFESASTATREAKCRKPADMFQVLSGFICVSVSLLIMPILP